MNIFYTILILALTLSSTLSPAQETDTRELFQKMIGDWNIEYRLRRAPSQDFTTGTGSAVFTEFHRPTQIKEEFSLGSAGGTAFINYSQTHNRYEFFQIDKMAPSSIFLIGQYSAEENRINFRGLDNLSQWGSEPQLDIRWEYQFLKDGSFKKEMYLKDSNGKYFLQSDYHYKPKQ